MRDDAFQAAFNRRAGDADNAALPAIRQRGKGSQRSQRVNKARTEGYADDAADVAADVEQIAADVAADFAKVCQIGDAQAEQHNQQRKGEPCRCHTGAAGGHKPPQQARGKGDNGEF